MSRRMVVDVAVCSGCRACEMACSFQHEDAFSPPLSRVRVVKIEAEGLDRPVLCRGCVKAACVEVCPTGALTKDGVWGNPELNSDECIGCGACVEACPFGAMHLHPETGLALVCDLCGGDPACVKRCTPRALRWGDPEEIARSKRETRARADVTAAAGDERAEVGV
ncbi:MAG: 4Fe-4S dicluster domain-containing protein [Bacillota bacterium]|nr:MAG: 4Fe-4S dicluster domain-containing protein [Bacillota bacterium]